MPQTAAPMLALSVAFVLLWNSGFIGAEYGLDFSGPLTLLFWRYLALSGLLLAWMLWRAHRLWPGAQAAWQAGWTGALAHAGWLGFALGAIATDVPAGIVELIVATQPLLTGALSGPVTGEGTSARQWCGLLIGFVGVAIAVTARLRADDAAPLWGYLLPLGSVAAITVASLAQRLRATAGAALPMDTLLLYQSFASAAVLLPLALLLEGLVTTWTPLYIAALAWVTIPVSLGAYALMWMLIARTDATRVASLFYFGPPVTMLMAWLAFGDVLKISDLVALVVTAAGIVLVQWRKRPVIPRPA